jgi:hypothetical protein
VGPARPLRLTMPQARSSSSQLSQFPQSATPGQRGWVALTVWRLRSTGSIVTTPVRALLANAAAERFERTGCAECLFVTAPCWGLSSEAMRSAVQPRIKLLGIGAISEELYRHVNFLLTQYRLD